MLDRYAALKYIQTLDPEKDAHQIVAVSSALDFAQDMEIALALAFFRTFAIPSIARILDETKQFEKFGQKRYDDTTILLAEFLENGLDSERGREAIRRMNQIHRQYNISNDDYLYVLTTFIFEPIRWIDRYGWRPLDEKERLAAFYFWRRVGEMMGIRDIPNRYSELEAFNVRYEREKFCYTPEADRVSQATLKVLEGFLPRLPGVGYLARECIYALCDVPLRRAVGFPDPNPLVQAAVEASLKARAFFLRHLGQPPQEPERITTRRFASYPNGYRIAEVGPVAVPVAAEQTASLGQ
jgi:hypothetical protein